MAYYTNALYAPVGHRECAVPYTKHADACCVTTTETHRVSKTFGCAPTAGVGHRTSNPTIRPIHASVPIETPSSFPYSTNGTSGGVPRHGEYKPKEAPRTVQQSTTGRVTEYPINAVFTERWSSRSFIPKEMNESTLLTMFDAARWAPSPMNVQPWRFVYCMRQSPEWNKWVDLMAPMNASWGKNSSALILVMSDKSNPKLAFTASFDTGAACANLYAQATLMGIATHPIAGFDQDKARALVKAPETLHIEAMIVVGYRDVVEALPKELQEREKPSSRKPIAEFAQSHEYRPADAVNNN
jgi:nitroreductase